MAACRHVLQLERADRRALRYRCERCGRVLRKPLGWMERPPEYERRRDEWFRRKSPEQRLRIAG